MSGFFAVQGDALVPTPMASSGWSRDQMRGMAVSGALARGTELALARVGTAEMRPARFTLDLFRPAKMLPTMVRTTVLRRGRRLCLIEARAEQESETVARALTLSLLPGRAPSGNVWSESRMPAPTPPPSHMQPDTVDERVYFSDEVGWTTVPGAPQSAGRKQSWHWSIPVVIGEEISPFQLAASVADVANLVSNWGDRGLEFINPDVTLSLARLPRGQECGLSALCRFEVDGISVGTATMFDRDGVFGTTAVVGLANAQHGVDPRAVAVPKFSAPGTSDV